MHFSLNFKQFSDEEMPSSSTKTNIIIKSNDQLHSTVPSEDEKDVPNLKTTDKDCDDGEVTSVAEFSDSQNQSCDNDADISEAEAEIETTNKAISKKSTRCVKLAGAQAIFTCNDCGKTFNRPGNLRRHERIIHFENQKSNCTKIRSKHGSAAKSTSKG